MQIKIKNIIDTIYPYNQIVWKNVFGYTVIHIHGLYGLYLLLINKLDIYSAVFLSIYHLLGGLGILCGAHRLWSHRSYQARLPLRILLMIFNCIAFQNDIYHWCRDHRTHHKFSDTDGDPYSSRRGIFFCHMGWFMVKKHPSIIQYGRYAHLDDLLEDPVVRFQMKYYTHLVAFFWALIPTSLIMYYFSYTVLEAFSFNMLHYMFTLHCTFTVNSLAHLYGDRPYNDKIEPRQNLLVSLLTMGEGYHNYHHAHPRDYKACAYPPSIQYNPTTLLIDFFIHVNLAYNEISVDKSKIKSTDEDLPKYDIRLQYFLGILFLNIILILNLFIKIFLYS